MAKKLNELSTRTPEIDDYYYISSNDGTVEGKVKLQDITVIPETSRTINFTSSQTAAQIQADIDAVGKYIPKGVIIIFQFGNGTYSLDSSLTFSFFYGGGQIFIYGDTSQTDGLHTNHNVHLDFSGGASVVALWAVHNRVSLISVSHLKITANANIICLQCQREGNYRVWYNYFISNSKTGSFGLAAQDGSTVWSTDNYFNNHNIAILSTQNAILYSDTNDDTGTQPNTGLNAQSGGKIGKSSTQPSGSSTNESTSTGGKIV